MPYYQLMAIKANARLSGDALAAMSDSEKAFFAPGIRLTAAARALNIATDQEAAFLDTLPERMLNQIREAIYGAITSKPPVPVLISWQAGSEYSVRVSEATLGGPTAVVDIRLVTPWPLQPSGGGTIAPP
jgi:hypothetical protein